MDWCGSLMPRTPEYRTMNEERHERKAYECMEVIVLLLQIGMPYSFLYCFLFHNDKVVIIGLHVCGGRSLALVIQEHGDRASCNLFFFFFFEKDKVIY